MTIGIDIGGTFTDLVAVDGDEIRVAKVPSTPDDPSRAFLDALGRVGGGHTEVRHGTTVATNAILTRQGARLGFLSTEGFRHVLHLARQDRPSLYDLEARRPAPLVDRERCLGVPERVGPQGEVLEPLDEAVLRERLASLVGEVEAVAVALLHAYANPDHERRVAELVREVLGDVHVSLSSDVLPEIREYERASTTVLNAYVQPVMERYLGRIVAGAASSRVGVMWSGGGVRSIDRTAARPVHTLLSGPAAGVLAGAWAADRAGFRDVVTLDIGGTSADVSLVEDGSLTYAEESSLDGLPFRTPCVDIVSVGAGGGSVAWIDPGGALRVGPRSAGAAPGPVCYGRGGTEPTVTDAHAVLGHLGDEGLAGGELTLDLDAAWGSVDGLGGMGAEEAAEGVLRVVRATMARAIRAVSVERGKDLRRRALVAFGGAGGLHGVALARELGISTVVVPPSPGTLAALGLLVAGRRAEASVSRPLVVEKATEGAVRTTLHELTEEALAELAEEGIGFADADLALALDLRYVGQSHELRITVEGAPSAQRITDAFAAAHRERYGFARPDVPVEVVTFRSIATGRPGEIHPHRPSAGEPPAPRSTRRAGGAEGVPVYDRAELPEGWRAEGPAVVVELDATTLVEEGSWVSVHPSGALVIEV